MVRSIRRVEVLLGNSQKQPNEAELAVAKIVRRSVVTTCEIAAGSVLEDSMLVLRRPGTGIPPAQLPEVLGRRSSRSITAGTLLSWEDLE
jgi:sialic acid synthase SpsE